MAPFKPTFHLPPHLSIAPPPKGPFHLGTVVRDFEQIEKARPLNFDDDRVPIPDRELQQDTKKGFKATRHDLKKGGFGIWAKFMGVEGIGAEASFAAERSEDDVYTCDELETVFFYPRPSYIAKSLKLGDVADYLVGCNYKKPVYLITGLKIAKGVAVNIKKAKKLNVDGKLGVHNPGGLPLSLGPSGNFSTEHDDSFSFSESSDIVIGIQCLMITHKKGIFGGVGKPVDELYSKGATLVDLEDEENEEMPGDFVCEELKEVEGKTIAQDDSGDNIWLVTS